MYAFKLGKVVMLLLPAGAFLAGLPLALGLVSRNHIYGVRTTRSLASDTAWYEVNERGGWAMVIGSAIAFGVILLIQNRMGETPSSILLQVGVFTICLAAAIALGIGLHI